MMRSRTWRRALIAAVALMAAVGVTTVAPTPAAAAGATAYNSRTLYLKFPPQPGNSACTHRYITLNAGNYAWQTLNSLQGQRRPADALNSRQIYLAYGNYLWQDCLYWYDVTGGSDIYIHYSWLDRQTGSASAELISAISSEDTPNLVEVNYGSSLTPL